MRLAMALFLSIMCVIVFSNRCESKMNKEEKKLCQQKLESLLLNKPLVAKVTFPASNQGIDLNIDGTWNNKKATGLIKVHGVGIEIDGAANVTAINLKGKHIEIHLNGGGYGTFAHAVLTDLNRSGHLSAGSRINLRFGRDIEVEDIEVEKIAKFLKPLVETTGLAQEIAQKAIPDEFKEAAEKGEIVKGMDKKTVYAIKGAPKDKHLDTEASPPVEKWQYDLSEFEVQVIVFEGGKVTKIDTF